MGQTPKVLDPTFPIMHLFLSILPASLIPMSCETQAFKKF